MYVLFKDKWWSWEGQFQLHQTEMKKLKSDTMHSNTGNHQLKTWYDYDKYRNTFMTNYKWHL